MQYAGELIRRRDPHEPVPSEDIEQLLTRVAAVCEEVEAQ